MGALIVIGIIIVIIVISVIIKAWNDASKDSRPVDYSQISARIDKDNQNLSELLNETDEEEEE